ncbi:endonuclease/exonuclease/phosphatase family protein [Jannaschia sp. LMIT008]|uniref:endonuclease/exonuclease/phosphatase family protein n=1 Tax=Jannaschia maritima TaxID=3032585 RepID=UPI0028127D3C|nr:endonuclease/exonuclease/phosphatase family protein [Jannaschia sp. LMIT008]
MVRDLLSGRDAQAEAALDVIAWADPDVILLGDVDWDASGAGLDALLRRLADHGLRYPWHVVRRPNAGLPSGADLDGDGRLGTARDALGYGRFTGDSGLVLLSRIPLGPVADHSAAPWADAGDLVPEGVSIPIPTVAQWVVPLEGTGLSLVTLAAGTPVFDGPEDRNGIRNAAELVLAATLAEGEAMPVLLGRANVDPVDGAGRRDAMRALLSHPRWRDPEPRGRGGGGDGHRGDPRLDTAAWEGPGPLRVDYVLVASQVQVLDAGVAWPAADDPFATTVAAAGTGRLVWVDLRLP